MSAHVISISETRAESHLLAALVAGLHLQNLTSDGHFSFITKRKEKCLLIDQVL